MNLLQGSQITLDKNNIDVCIYLTKVEITENWGHSITLIRNRPTAVKIKIYSSKLKYITHYNK